MKKIKYLLWLSIVWVWLLINQSFWCDDVMIEYADSNNNIITFSVWDMSWTWAWSYFSWFVYSLPQYLLQYDPSLWYLPDFSFSSTPELLNFDTYSLENYPTSDYSKFTQQIVLSKKSITILWNWNNHFYYMFKPTSRFNESWDSIFDLHWLTSVGCANHNATNKWSYFLHINWDSTCINKNVLSNWNCDFSSYSFHHTSIPYSIINWYEVHDSIFEWVEYYKWSITYSTKNSYSFWISNCFSWQDCSNSLGSDVFFLPRTVIYGSDSSVSYLDWVFFARLYENLYDNDSSDFKIIWIFWTWTNDSDYQFLYNIYNCPSTALSPYDCSFLTWWYLLESDYSSSDFYVGRKYYDCNSWSLFCPWDYLDSFPIGMSNPPRPYHTNFILTYNSNSWLLLIHFPSGFTPYINSSYNTYNVMLSNSPSVSDILTWITPPTPPVDEIQTFNNFPFSSYYYRCLWPVYNTSNWLPPADCLNPDWTLIDVNDYKDCFYTFTWWDGITQNLYCDNDWYIQEMTWVADWSWGYYTPCTWDNCWQMFVIWPDSLNFYPFFELSTWLIEDMFTNITGWIGRCPFPYTDFQLWQNNQLLKYLKSLGFEYDPFIFVNCVVAWFNHWRHIIDDIAFDDIFEHPLIYWDTSQHRLLFVFLDFIVILWLFSLISFIKKIF